MVCMIWTCCNLWNGLINLYMRMISGVVCHGNNDKCWSDGVVKCSCGGICDVIWYDFCMNYHNCDFDIHECDCDLYLCLYLSQQWCLELDLAQCLVCCLLWCAGMPDGGNLSGQCAAMWPYSSHSKQCTLGQWHVMWPNSWHWKHWSPSLDITLTVEEDDRIAVNCCTAWSFSISLMVSVKRVWGPFS